MDIVKIKLPAAVVILALLAGCQTAPPLFEFGSYEQSLYVYYKKPDQADRYRESLEKAIEKGEKNDNVAPGMYAELGYLVSLQGDHNAAIEMYQMEMEKFPESSFFLKRVIALLQDDEPMPSDKIQDPEAGA